MVYKFASKTNYEHLAAGGVIKSYKGNTNFPVRLGHEIYNRCVSYLAPNTTVSIYDPMCGTGYLLTIIGLLNFNRIDQIYGSDINQKVLTVAETNLSLLTLKGLRRREVELQNLHTKYDRDSHKQTLEHIQTLKKTVVKDINYKLFHQDIFDPNDSISFTADIIIVDLPYGQLIQYEGDYSINNLEDRIKGFIESDSVVGVIRNRNQKLSIGDTSNRREKIVVGKRMIEIYKKREVYTKNIKT